jgi:hypothetical protein
MKYTKNYTHSLFYPGSVFDSRHNGKFYILGKMRDKARRGYYAVQFEDSGIIKKAYSSHIKSGKVSDEDPATSVMTPKYFGIGYIGDGVHSTYSSVADNRRSRMFILWHNMLARCYSVKDDGKQVHNGYRGVIVISHWHNFQHFCDDLPSIPGYSNWLNNPGEYELDKDFCHERVYSPDTVCFITTADNAREAGLRRSALRITSGYNSINARREILLFDVIDVLTEANIQHSVKYVAVTQVITIPSPYGVVVYYPLTQKIQRMTTLHDGDVKRLIQYIHWLRNQWISRNSDIENLATEVI